MSFYFARSQVLFRAQFEAFNNAIRLKPFDENATLRQKRDRILTRLTEKCSYTFESFNQGSYQMRTGVVPVNGDYDIDVGIVFGQHAGENSAYTVKRWVYDALNGHTKDVRIRQPCVTVTYQQAGEPLYHVDLAVYMKGSNGSLYLARGRDYSGAAWEHSDPIGAMRALTSKFSGDDAAQFRRVVRYLKRWRDQNFSSAGNAAPVGIGLTICAYQHLQISKAGATYDDFTCLSRLVDTIRGSFSVRFTSSGFVYRLVARMPTAPFDDVFQRMTDRQMTEFKERLDTLAHNLALAKQTGSAASLRKAFGADFPS